MSKKLKTWQDKAAKALCKAEEIESTIKECETTIELLETHRKAAGFSKYVFAPHILGISRQHYQYLIKLAPKTKNNAKLLNRLYNKAQKKVLDS